MNHYFFRGRAAPRANRPKQFLQEAAESAEEIRFDETYLCVLCDLLQEV